MLIRPLVIAADLPALQALWRATWLDTYGPILGPSGVQCVHDALAEPAVLSMFAPDGGGFVAEDGGEVLGSVCFAERHGIGYVWGMYVHPAHQRRGVGATLLRHAAGAMVEAVTLELSTVTPASEAFYRRLGFTVTGHAGFELFPGVLRPSTHLAVDAASVRGRAAPPLDSVLPA